MKRIKQNLMFAALAVFAALTASCFTPFDPPPSVTAEGAGRVVLTVSSGQAGSARTVLPGKNQVFNRYELVFSKEGEEDVTPANTTDITGAGVSQDLAAGTWTAAVKAYNRFTPTGGEEKEYLAARGNAEVSITSGAITPVTVHLEPVMETGVKGIFSYTVTFPSVDAAAVTLGTGYSASLESGTNVSVEVEPGYYDLTITLSKAGAIIAGAAETVHIYSGLKSEAEYIFGNDFSLLKGPGDSVTATAQSATSILVSWDGVSGAESYNIYRGDSVDGEYTLVTSSTGTSYTNTGLSEDTIYYYKVSAVTGGVEGPKSDCISAATLVLAPSGITATQLSSSGVLVSWNGVSGATIYKVYRYSGSYPNSDLFVPVGSSTETSYTDTGLSPSTTYYYKVSAAGKAVEGSQSTSYASAATMSEAEDTTIEGVYIGIISFAGTASDLGLVRLNASGRTTLLNQLDDSYTIASQSGTALFYAVHKALANLKSRENRYPADLESVNVLTFTDGLDNASTGKSAADPIEEQTFDTDNEYTTYLSEQIADRTIAGKSISAYSVGVRGDDVADTTKFGNDLEKIAGTGNSRILTDFGDLQTTFQGIADSLQVMQVLNTTFTMKTTLLGSGTKVRMTFDVTGTSASDAAASSKYIEGTITRTGTGTNMAYTFNTITYAGGLGSEQGAGPITGVINGSEINFAFTGVDGYIPASDESKAKQWLMPSDATAWQRNSEYSVTGATTTEIDSLSSIIYLVLDSSTSLDTTNIGLIRSAAKAFINSLYSQIYMLVPSGVSAATAGSNSVTVSWNRVSSENSSNSVNGYYIYRATSSDGPYTRLNNNYTTSYTDTGLSPNTAYYYKVSANIYTSYYDSWEGAQSSYASATTSPSAPSGVTATAVDSSSITVSWAQVSGATGYKVYRSTTYSGTYSLEEDSTSTSYTDTELSPITIYYYKVSAYNDNGEGTQSSYFFARTKLTTPSNVTAMAASSSSITVSWDHVSGTSYYYVYRATSNDGTYTLVTDSVSSSSVSYTNTGLSADTTYYYKVSAYNSNYGESTQSSYVFATTTQ
ncbi:MAG: fibronectin type III domain-containing protein [Treponema sp.]|jgi:fibronectin type 3 domain-containing protein|nr:fibronectin type III domain-containing protein [Treponema sp.]